MTFSRPIRLVIGAFAVIMLSLASLAQVNISVNFGPPPLPVYEQPPCPAEGYIWSPGYWAWGPWGYYWVPGTWVLAPMTGYLWTPPWWGWDGYGFLFHEGYWGPRVGFYGGVPYGYGYFGHGYEGGRWQDGRFFYNQSVSNVNVTNITNVYNTTVINNVTNNRTSYNGGEGGITTRPSPDEEAAARETHVPPTSTQIHHAQAAFTNPDLRASTNHGKPPIAATPRAGAYTDRAIVPAKEAGGPFKPEENLPRSSSDAVHAKDITAHPRPHAPNTSDPNLNLEYQKQQDKLYLDQEQEHQKIQEEQERDHMRMDQQKSSQQQRQQTEQKHQQQTQQMEEMHAQQQERMQAQQHSRNR